MIQQTQQEVQRFVGVASTVAGLICYALSSSFNNLFGKWSLFKIFAYLVSSSIICLAVLFPKAWRHLRILHHYRAHFAFLVLISTTIYSFYLDRKSKTKPDAYSLISSAAFATTSLCMSMQIECGFLDLMYFFCGLLVMQLMQIKPLLVFVGIGFGYFLVILRCYLDAPPNRSQSQPPQVVINMASLQQSGAFDARPQEEEGSNQNRSTTFDRRKTLPRWTKQVRFNPGMGVEWPLDDGYSWRKYGQKEILGAKYPRGYYRCTHRKVQGCLATKQVQRSDEDPTVFEITYIGQHTCTAASSSNAVPATSPKENQDSNLNTNPQQQQQQNVLQSLEQQPINEQLMNPREGLRVQTENLDAPDQPPFVGSLKTLPRWTKQVRVNPGMGVEGSPDDGYSWRKYGQKDILGAKYPRGYYRCTHRKVQGCLATKQVQRSDEDPTVFEITYRGRHTCTAAPSSNAVPATSTKENQDSNLNTNPQQQQNVLQSLEGQPINDLLLNPREGLKVQTENQDAPDQPPFLGSLYFPSTSNIKTDNQVFPASHPVLPENFTPPSSPLPPQE